MMHELEAILEEARRIAPAPPRSKLDDYAEILWELRRKRKRVRSIVDFLQQHGLLVGKSTVARWLKAHPVPQTEAPRAGQSLPRSAASREDRDRAHRFFNSNTEEP